MTRAGLLALSVAAAAAACAPGSILGQTGLRNCVDDTDSNCAMWGVRPQSVGDAGLVFIEADGGCSSTPDAGACALCAEADCCAALSSCPTDGGTCAAVDVCLRASCSSFCPESP